MKTKQHKHATQKHSEQTPVAEVAKNQNTCNVVAIDQTQFSHTFKHTINHSCT